MCLKENRETIDIREDYLIKKMICLTFFCKTKPLVIIFCGLQILM